MTNSGFSFFPKAASAFASEVDLFYFYLVAVSGFFAVLIFVLVIFFAIKYQRRAPNEMPEEIYGSLLLEIA